MRAEASRGNLEGTEHEHPLEGYPPVTVALPCGESYRSIQGVLSLLKAVVPPESHIHLKTGMAVAQSLNGMIREFLEDGDEFFWCQADDHIWSAGALKQLIDRNVHVVVPIMTRRSPPFTPLLFKARHEDGYEPYQWRELPASGLFPVYAAGSGGMLLSRWTIETLIEAQGHDRVFEYEDGLMREDLYLCEKLHQHIPDLQIYADTQVVMGHHMECDAWPFVDDQGNWSVTFDMGVDEEGRHALVNVGE